MSDKRIIDLEAKQTLGSGDYLAADSAQGTYKVDADTNIMTPLTNVRNNVANSSASPDKYSSSTAYKVGDMVVHDDILYICTTACSAASWAVNSACFTATTLASAITQLNSDLSGKLGKIIGNSGNPTDYKIRIGYNGNLQTNSNGLVTLPDINITYLLSVFSADSSCYCVPRKARDNQDTILYFFDADGNPKANSTVAVRYYYLVWV